MSGPALFFDIGHATSVLAGIVNLVNYSHLRLVSSELFFAVTGL